MLTEADKYFIGSYSLVYIGGYEVWWKENQARIYKEHPELGEAVEEASLAVIKAASIMRRIKETT
ncbi:MAG: hypothetical protein JKY81_02450 [Colwellia sp.]|nr:hypothetical protein [Colwellia sp.]